MARRGANSFRWLWAVLLLIAQVHICQAIFVKDDGRACQVCPTLSDAPGELGLTSPSHGDCHDCCQLRACDESGVKVASKTIQAPQVVAILPDAFVVPRPTAPTVVKVRIFCVESCPPTGPPTQASPRAPPFLPTA